MPKPPNQPTLRIFLAGATGVIGIRLLPLLLAQRNDRIRTEGTRNLVAAAKAAGAVHFLAQSIAWRPPGRGEIVEQHERRVLDAGGVVVRYGQLYGPGTFYEDQLPPPPRIHVDAASQATPPLIQAPSGVVVLAEEADPA